MAAEGGILLVGSYTSGKTTCALYLTNDNKKFNPGANERAQTVISGISAVIPELGCPIVDCQGLDEEMINPQRFADLFMVAKKVRLFLVVISLKRDHVQRQTYFLKLLKENLTIEAKGRCFIVFTHTGAYTLDECKQIFYKNFQQSVGGRPISFYDEGFTNFPSVHTPNQCLFCGDFETEKQERVGGVYLKDSNGEFLRIPSDEALRQEFLLHVSQLSNIPISLTNVFKPEAACCLSANNYVRTLRGSAILMGEVKVGDLIEVSENKFEPVLEWLHRDNRLLASFIRIQIHNDDGKEEPYFVELSERHLLPIEGKGFIFAKDVNLTDRLFVHESWKSILSIEVITRVGVYAPSTRSGTIQLSNGIQVSCYAEVKHQEMARVFMVVRDFWKKGIFHGLSTKNEKAMNGNEHEVINIMNESYISFCMWIFNLSK